MKYSVTYEAPTLIVEAKDEYEAQEKYCEKLEWMQYEPELEVKEVEEE